MPKLTKIYTRTGDDGTTALGTARRVPKDSPRITAYGEVDELNALLGYALTQGLAPRLAESLPPIQNQLFHLGSDLAFPQDDEKQVDVPRIEQRHIDALEALIDELNDQLGTLQNFILPGGSPGAAVLHLARTVCRRTERGLVTLASQETINPLSLTFLNRLSDALFVFARYENKEKGIEDPYWDSRA